MFKSLHKKKGKNGVEGWFQAKNGQKPPPMVEEWKERKIEENTKIEKTPVDELIDLVGDSLIEYK